MARPLRETPRRTPLAAAIAAVAIIAVIGATATGAGAARTGGVTAPSSSHSTPLDGNGMWIWYVSKSGGSAAAIIARARAHKIRTVFVKSGDGTNYWSFQFTPQFVSSLKAGGLRVCAWQYVYGDRPGDEANVAARAAKAGADCFVIDAEAQYEGKYAAAAKYVHKLRGKVGSKYPIGLAGFPYVDYHPSFPFSVFLGPGGAQFNVPQVYWKEIGGGVDTVLGHTYRWNRLYGRGIYPLGQLYQGVNGRPGRYGILRFRKYARAEGARGVSWWDWQEATDPQWKAVGDPLSAFNHSVEKNYATLSTGSAGDFVLWAQEHLRGAGKNAPLSGSYDSSTKNAVKSFQRSNGLTVNGQVDKPTWVALLRYHPVQGRSTKLSAASAGQVTPPTADLPAKRYEIPPAAGRH